MPKYAKSNGALFIEKHRQGEQPHFRGNLEITSEQVQKLKQMAQAGQEPKLTLSAWKKKAQSGINYISISAEAYIKEQKADSGWNDDSFDDEDDFAEDDIPF